METPVYDQVEPCPYLPGRLARLPLRRPRRALTPSQLDDQLELGDRRCGIFLYRTACSGCQACEPIRLDVKTFRMRTTQRRVLRRGSELLEVMVGPPQVDDERVDLFNRHRQLRGLEGGQGPIDAWGYFSFLGDTCCRTMEIQYRLDGNLVAVAVCDVGEMALSAVYCYYEPTLPHLSLGTFSVLWQMEMVRRTQRRYLYLGYYIAESPHMNYKAGFRPHERLTNGTWNLLAG